MKRWSWLIPLLLAIVVYAPAPWSELVWDDPVVFERQMVAFDSVGDVFKSPDGISQWSVDYYRPVVVLSYMLDMNLYGYAPASGPQIPAAQTAGVYISAEQTGGASGSAAGFHISNVIYHALTTFFVWLLARRLLVHQPNGTMGALMAAAIFAVHPIHTESVSWIAGRSDVLAAMFLIPGVLLALLWRDTGARWALIACALLYLLALMSKEVAVAALVIVPVALLLIPGPGDMRTEFAGTTTQKNPADDPLPQSAFGFRSHISMWLSAAIMLLGVTGFYLALRYTDGAAYGMPLDVPWVNYVVRLEKSIAYYLVKAFLPWPQSNHAAWESAPGFIATNTAFLIATGLLVLGIYFWRRQRDGSLLFAWVWFGAALAPSVAVAVRNISATPLAERYLYLPSVGLALLLGIACCQPMFGKWRKPAAWATAALVAFYFVVTLQRGMVWTNNLALWSDTTQKVPSHGEPWNQLGIAYLGQRDFVQARDAFERVIELDSTPYGRAAAKHNIAIIYQLQNDLPRAMQYYSAAIDENVDNPDLHYGLGVLYKTEARNIKLGNGQSDRIGASLDKAATQFSLAISLNPYHSLARWGLASVLALQGENYEIAGASQRALIFYRSALAEIDALTSQTPAYRNQADVQNTRAALSASLLRLEK